LSTANRSSAAPGHYGVAMSAAFERYLVRDDVDDACLSELMTWLDVISIAFGAFDVDAMHYSHASIRAHLPLVRSTRLVTMCGHNSSVLSISHSTVRNKMRRKYIMYKLST
jgi:hypothetical protein